MNDFDVDHRYDATLDDVRNELINIQRGQPSNFLVIVLLALILWRIW